MPATREKAHYEAGPFQFNVEEHEPEIPLGEFVGRIANHYATAMKDEVVAALEADGYDPDKPWSEQ